VSEVERVVLVDLLAGLLLLGDARIEEPAVLQARRLFSKLAVDVHGGEERKPPLLVQHDGEVVVRQEVFRLAGRELVRRRELNELVRQRRQRHSMFSGAEELALVSTSSPVVGIDVNSARSHRRKRERGSTVL